MNVPRKFSPSYIDGLYKRGAEGAGNAYAANERDYGQVGVLVYYRCDMDNMLCADSPRCCWVVQLKTLV